MRLVKIVLMLVVVGSFALGQTRYANNTTTMTKLTGGASLYNIGYTTATLDTTVKYEIRDFKTIYVVLQSTDSASLGIKYQTSIDGSTWSPLTIFDTLVTTSNVGDYKSMDLTSVLGGAFYVRFAVYVNNAAKIGVSTPKYYAYITRKQF